MDKAFKFIIKEDSVLSLGSLWMMMQIPIRQV